MYENNKKIIEKYIDELFGKMEDMYLEQLYETEERNKEIKELAHFYTTMYNTAVDYFNKKAR